MQHTKKKFLISLALFSFFLTACDTTTQLVDINSNAPETAQNENEEIQLELGSHSSGTRLKLIEKYNGSGRPVYSKSYHPAAQNGDLNLKFFYIQKTAEEETPDSAHAVLAANVNGMLYDFSADGRTSKNGLLELDLPVNGEKEIPFSISGCAMDKGENLLQIYVFSYDESLHTSSAMYSNVIFTSDQTCPTESTVSISDYQDIAGIESEPFNGRTAQELNNADRTVCIIDQNSEYYKGSFDDTGLMKVKQNTPLQFQLYNENDSGGASNRSGYCFAMANGKPLNVWNDQPLLKMEMKESEFKYTIPGQTDFDLNERYDITFFYIDTKNDIQNPFLLIPTSTGSLIATE